MSFKHFMFLVASGIIGALAFVGFVTVLDLLHDLITMFDIVYVGNINDQHR